MTSRDPRHQRLLDAALLVRDLRLGDAAAARRVLAASRMHDAALEASPITSTDPAVQAAAQQHRLWAEGRRRALAPIIAAQEQVMAQRRVEAARAMARWKVLERLFVNLRD